MKKNATKKQLVLDRHIIRMLTSDALRAVDGARYPRSDNSSCLDGTCPN